MNWLVIALVLVLAWHIAWGYQRGLLRVLYSLGKWILILVLLVWLTPILSKGLSQTSLYDGLNANIKGRIEAQMEEKLEEKADQETNSLAMELPKAVQEKIPTAVELANGTLEATGAYDAAAKELTDLAMLGIAAIFVVLACVILCIAINHLFQVVEKLPGIEQVNHILGVIGGAVKGLLIIWVFMAILAAETGTAPGRFLLPYIYEAPVLQAIYENNLLLTIMMAFF